MYPINKIRLIQIHSRIIKKNTNEKKVRKLKSE